MRGWHDTPGMPGDDDSRVELRIRPRRRSSPVRSGVDSIKNWFAGLSGSRDDVTTRGPISHALSNAPPWLVSLLLHMLLMLGLGLLAFEVHRAADRPVTAEIAPLDIYAETLGSQLVDPTAPRNGQETNSDDTGFAPSELPEVDDPFAAPQKFDDGLGAGSIGSLIEAPTIGMALSGREAGRKEALHAAYGGTKLTKEAVAQALDWLARNQRPDGFWSLVGPYKDGAFVENRLAATAMAMLAFQGDGQTHTRAGAHQKSMRRACDALLKLQEQDGGFDQAAVPQHHSLYTHAQCTIVLCELYGMTDDSRLRDPAQRAINYCVKSQAPEGGWRYNPGRESDTSVAGWFVMALQSGRMAKLNVPDETLQSISKSLDTVALAEGSRYAYMPGSHESNALTAEGLLCRQYLGWSRDDPRLLEGVRFINQNRVDWGARNVYYWYYATQVTHHMGGDYWKQWNDVMRQVLPENQIKQGKERGSWDPLLPTPDDWGGQAGRLYVTCLSTYMLEVYYRHLPLYAHAVSAHGPPGDGDPTK